ncbi:MAG: hypothetical protein QOJ42_5968, partial [Acidobacteriaceae bacterium]|nr:hypothetical protein [Acidobacteriaceae bacterium]
MLSMPTRLVLVNAVVFTDHHWGLPGRIVGSSYTGPARGFGLGPMGRKI